MIRLGQHRRIPRERLIGEDTVNWLKDGASGVGAIIFMIVAWWCSQHALAALAWAHEFRLAVIAGDHTLTLWP